MRLSAPRKIASPILGDGCRSEVPVMIGDIRIENFHLGNNERSQKRPSKSVHVNISFVQHLDELLLAIEQIKGNEGQRFRI